MKCYLCNEDILDQLTFKTLFTIEKKRLCDDCRSRLLIVNGGCIDCGKPSTVTVCNDCDRWRMKKNRVKNHSLYVYNEFAKELINLVKYNGHQIILEAFRYEIASFLLNRYKTKEYIVIPVPIASEKLKDRGFNQSQVLADCLPYKQHHIIKKNFNFTQSKRTKEERLQANNDFSFSKPVGDIRGKKIIIVDDIYTTGSTIHQISQLLYSVNVREIISFTLFRS